MFGGNNELRMIEKFKEFNYMAQQLPDSSPRKHVISVRGFLFYSNRNKKHTFRVETVYPIAVSGAYPCFFNCSICGSIIDSEYSISKKEGSERFHLSCFYDQFGRESLQKEIKEPRNDPDYPEIKNLVESIISTLDKIDNRPELKRIVFAEKV